MMLGPRVEKTDTMQIHCKTCGAPLDEAAMDRSRGLARCRHCDTVVELDFSQPAPGARTYEERAPVAMPARFTLDHVGGQLQISWQWFTLKAALWAAFTVIWFLALGGYYANILGPGGSAEAGLVTQQILFTLGHVIVGLVVAYIAASGFLNTTTIRATHNSLRIQHSPLPWPGNTTVDDIRQLYSKERVLRGKHGRRSYSYELHVITKGGEQRRLIDRLDEAAQALWLEQTLEEHLRIQDQPVPRELPRH